MRILGLLNSNIHGGDANIPREELFPNAMAAPLGKVIGEPVEVTARSVWPTERLVGHVSRWMDEVQPDLVVFPVSAFWFLYESTPVRLERRLGRTGRTVSRAARRIASTPRLAHNPAFQWGRKRTQKLIGGQSWFEPEQVIEVAQDVIREVLRREGTSYLIVFGPSGGEKWATGPASLERLVRRRTQVDSALREFCAERHVEYWDAAKNESIRDPRPSSLQGDDLHLDRAGHKRVAEYQFGLAVGMVKRALEATREPAAGLQP